MNQRVAALLARYRLNRLTGPVEELKKHIFPRDLRVSKKDYRKAPHTRERERRIRQAQKLEMKRRKKNEEASEVEG